MREKNEYGQIRPGRPNAGRIEDMLPGRRGSPGGTEADSRLFLEAVLWRAGTGSPRRDLPEEFGNWNSVSERFRRWARKGVFNSIFKVLSENFDLEYVSIDGTVVQAHAKASGGKGGPIRRRSGDPRSPATKIVALVDALGYLVCFELLPGQAPRPGGNAAAFGGRGFRGSDRRQGLRRRLICTETGIIQ